ncbi:MAG: PQQ-dependent sugar dehydrogenase [Candidatus Nanopelagicaceae bacterium]
MNYLIRSLIAVLSASLLLSFLSPARSNETELEIDAINLRQTQVEGGRGAALAVGLNGTLYLGGGEQGDTLFRYQDQTLFEMGRISEPNERLRDSRFGPTDVAILKESETEIEFLISYPQLDPANRCVRLVAFRYTWQEITQTLTKGEQWFEGKPCVPVGAVQHAAGRIEVINAKSAYLTTGDLGFRSINDRDARGWLGGVFKITQERTRQISEGHRNPQGILRVGKSLYISEHGPRGGDEINLIEKGKDYGWPFVTFGEPYSSGDYVRPEATGTHAGYTRPLISWVPSVAPTELVRLPRTAQWGNKRGAIVMGTLAEESLIFIERTSKRKMKEVERIYIGERIRDLEVGANGELIATSDSGKILFITRR